MDSGSDCGGVGGEESNEICNWTDEVDDLVDDGNVDGAISLLESIVSRLQTLETSSATADPSGLPLASALEDLAKLYSSQGRSLKADHLRTRSVLIRTRAIGISAPEAPSRASVLEVAGETKAITKVDSEVPVSNADGVDDWEAIAERVPLPDVGISKIVKEDTVDLGNTSLSGKPKRRGRGSFLYNKNELYSDDVDVGKATERFDSEEDSGRLFSREDDLVSRNMSFGTRHILLLYDFPPSTQTMDLEKLFESFKESGVAIRWVNDTSALAVFRTPGFAHEAQKSVRPPLTVRRIDEDDSLLDQFSAKDLEPPYPRPKTSARTAHRMIAHVMGLKPSAEFGSNELREQEAARKNRIRTRQNMRDDAWGSDD